MRCSALGLTFLVVLFLPAWVPAQDAPVAYELLSGSFIRDECEFCDRIPIQRAIRGTFDMARLQPGADVQSWSISAIDLLSAGDPADYAVEGDGSYQIVDFKTQSMSLKVGVNGVKGIDLESGALPLTVDAPFLDITMTEPKPYRDPNHIFTIRILAAPKVESVSYELVSGDIDGSIFRDDCLPCARPPFPVPIAGTFLLGKVGEDPLYAYYRVDDIEFVSLLDSFFVYITGSGKYRQGGEVALLQEMDLELKVELMDLTTSGAILASGIVPVGAVFPSIAVDLEHRNPESDIHVFFLHIVARPAAIQPTEFRRADANGDGEVDIADAVYILLWRFGGGARPDCLDAADADHSGVHDLTDAVYVLNYLFLGGKPPPAPGPAVCGLPIDPSLGCASYTACR